MNVIYNLRIFFIYLLFSFALFSQQINEKSVIRNITFTGVKRTKQSTLRNIIYPIKSGTIYTDNITNEISQRLFNENIFTPNITFDVKEDNGYVDINIDVTDKWTLIPAPMFSVSSQNWYVGLAILEMNLLGLNKKLSITGRYGSKGWDIGAIYSDPRFIIDRLSFDVDSSGGKNYTKDYNIKTKEFIREYQNIFCKQSIILGLNVVEEFKMFFGIKYEIYTGVKNTLSQTSSQQHIGLAYGIEYKNIKYSYPFNKGYRLHIENTYNFSLDINSKDYIQAKISFNAAFVFAKINRVGFNFSTGYGNSPPQKEFRLGDFEGTFILPSSIVSADNYMSLFSFYEIFIFDIKWKEKSLVAFSIQPFYELGFIKNDVFDIAFYHGPGIALLIYPSIIAVKSATSIGIKFGWDIQNKSFNFIASASKAM